MGYYQGDYYMAGQQASGATPGASSFWSTLGAVGGKILQGVSAVQQGRSQGAQMFLPGMGKAGAVGQLLGAVAGGAAPGMRRRYRRMNVTNVKALRRGMRRVQGFAKLARSTIGFTQRVKMKRRRRR